MPSPLTSPSGRAFAREIAHAIAAALPGGKTGHPITNVNIIKLDGREIARAMRKHGDYPHGAGF